jgi:hypothetical protein
MGGFYIRWHASTSGSGYSHFAVLTLIHQGISVLSIKLAYMLSKGSIIGKWMLKIKSPSVRGAFLTFYKENRICQLS